MRNRYQPCLPDPCTQLRTDQALAAQIASLQGQLSALQGQVNQMAQAPDYSNASIVTLTTSQATGIDPIIAQDTGRRGLKIQPPANCLLLLSSASATGIQLVGGFPNGFDGGNALYVSGLSTGDTLVIWTAD